MRTDPTLHHLWQQLNATVVGKPDTIRLTLVCLLAGGHLLLEDLPGVGKTTLAQALARSLGWPFSRVQFTADLMPSDLLGVSVYEPAQQRFVFHPGPVFAQVLLADEINRASPRTQSALLEAMEEQQVSADGTTHPLPQPFFVIATQNPLEQHGTHPLPESQLDRFLMRLSLGYPNRASERALLTGQDRRSLLADLPQQVSRAQWADWQAQVQAVHASDALLDYLQDLVDATRRTQALQQGLSPRAALSLLKAARAHAWTEGRDYVAPQDLAAVWLPCTAHRVRALGTAPQRIHDALQHLLQHTALR
jgi:MoxR-like ATPase